MTESSRRFLGADLLVSMLEANGFHAVSLNPGASEEIIASALERHSGVNSVLAYQELTALRFAGGLILGERARQSTSDDQGQLPIISEPVRRSALDIGTGATPANTCTLTSTSGTASKIGHFYFAPLKTFLIRADK